MYVFYEHHRDASNTISLTEIRLSSRMERFEINFYVNKEKAVFDLCKVVLKNAPVGLRSHDPALFIWSYLGDAWGQLTLKQLQDVTAALGGLTTVEVEDLAGYCRMGGYKPELRAKQPKAEDFFYKNEPAKTVVSKESVVPALAKLIEISEQELIAADEPKLKKLYRLAAMRLHPDRNNGDGSRMSELNMLWGIYNT